MPHLPRTFTRYLRLSCVVAAIAGAYACDARTPTAPAPGADTCLLARQRKPVHGGTTHLASSLAIGHAVADVEGPCSPNPPDYGQGRPVVYLSPVNTRLQRAIQVGLVVLLSGCHRARVFPTPSTCSVKLSPPARLVLSDGRLVYVQPTAYAASAQGEILIAGLPTLLGVNSSQITADSAIGVIADGNSIARVVQAPINVRTMGQVKALARPDGGWDILIAEGTSPTSRDTVLRLWYGVYDGHGWRSLNQVPVPRGMRLLASGVSEPIRVGDTLLWALRVQNPTDLTTNALVLRHAQTGWSSEVVPTRRAVYLALNHSAGEGLQLAVVAPDVSEERDANSLFVWTATPVWTMRRRVSFGAVDGPAHYPTYDGGNPPVITWYVEVGGDGDDERRELRSLFNPLLNHNDGATIINPQLADRVPVSSLRLDNGVHVWVTHSQDGDNRNVRVVFSTDQAGRHHTFPSPYRTSIRALVNGLSEIVIIGGVEDTGSYPVTALVRVRIVCS